MANGTIVSHIKSIANGTADPNTGLSRVGGSSADSTLNANARSKKSADYQEDRESHQTKAADALYIDSNSGTAEYLDLTVDFTTDFVDFVNPDTSVEGSETGIEHGISSPTNYVGRFLVAIGANGSGLYEILSFEDTDYQLREIIPHSGAVSNLYLIKSGYDISKLLNADTKRNNYTKLAFTVEDIKNRQTVKTRQTSTAIRLNRWNANTGTWTGAFPQSSDDTSSTAIASDNVQKMSYSYGANITRTEI